MVPRRTLVLVALLCAVAVSMCGCKKREIRNHDSRGTSIVCLGDSLTFGYGAESSQSYPRMLAVLTGMPVVNAGIDGETTAGAAERLTCDVLQKNPRLVIIELGGNDFLTKVSLEKTSATMKEMISRIHQQGAMVALVDISSGMFLNDYAPLYRALAQETGCMFLPGILTGIITNPTMKSDFLHPNARGYRLIALRISQELQRALSSF